MFVIIFIQTEGSEIVVEGPRCSLRSRKVRLSINISLLLLLLILGNDHAHYFVFWAMTMRTTLYSGQVISACVPNDKQELT
jgi:hypothetical protein